ncbi:uncharacterized protein LOC142894271 [Nelusetta ayraudi]|uniref:uncharacterized protein LOC142894271 n=1 Tax=Nelusetta ayraudi TaxID=303726 RepID=UPI003F6E8591
MTLFVGTPDPLLSLQLFTTGKQQNELLHQLSQKEKVVLGGDVRADSPGHSAKFGSYTTMDLDTNTIVDMQLIQSNEVGGSYHMEKEGLKRSLALLDARGVTVDCIVTDRHPQIQKFLRENNVTHYYDVWHIAKACLHESRQTRDKKKWLSAETPAFCRLEKVMANKRILKDVAKLSPHHQTSSLEAFHSVILRFAPKNVVFPFLGMLYR